MSAPPRAERRSLITTSPMRRAMFDTKRRFTQLLLNREKDDVCGVAEANRKSDDDFKCQKKIEIQELNKMLVRLAGAIKG